MQAPGPRRRAAIIFILVTVLVDGMAFGIILPVLPKLVTGFVSETPGRGAVIYGLFLTVWAFMRFALSPLLGVLSDRFGRRPIILISSFGLGLDFLLMAFAPTLGWLFLGHVISGVTSAGATPAAAYIADITPPGKRAARFGLLGAAGGLGFVAGPALGGLLSGFNPQWPFLAAAGLTLINFFFGLLIVPESLPVEKRKAFSWRRANPIGSVKLLRSNRQLLGLSVAGFIGNLGFYVVPSVFVLSVIHRYGWDDFKIGLALMTIGITEITVQSVLVRTVVARIGERATLIVGALIETAAYIIFGFAPTGWLFLLGIPVMALGQISDSALASMMTQQVDDQSQGELQGALSSLSGIAGLFAPSLFAVIYGLFIGTWAHLSLPGAPFLLAGALFALATGVAWYATRAPAPGRS